MNGNYNLVKIRMTYYNCSHDYICAAYESYAVNDYVVVSSLSEELQIAQVIEVDNVWGVVLDSREIVCKIDMATYENRKARAKRKIELKHKMDAKVEKFKEAEIFEMLAKEDNEMAEMLKEFKDLG